MVDGFGVYLHTATRTIELKHQIWRAEELEFRVLAGV